MSTIRFLSENIVDGSVALTSGTADSGFEIENLLDLNKHVQFKAAGDASTILVIDIDLGAARTVDSFIMGNHGYNDTGLGIKLAYDDAGVGDYASLTYRLGSAVAYHDYVAANAVNWYESITSTSARYWRIYIEPIGAGNTNEIGNIFLGALWEHANNPEFGVREGYKYLTEMGKTKAGIVHSQLNNSNAQRMWSYNYQYIIASEKTNFENWLDDIKGNQQLSHYPFFLIDCEDNIYYVRLDGLVEFQEQAYQVWQTTINLEEEI